jgi:PPK2 family polyphosphate:nucleotide phosphotransferase
VTPGTDRATERSVSTASRYLVPAGKPFRLRDRDPADASLFDAAAEGQLERLSERINELEDVLCAAHDRSLLIVLQGMDGSGKDEIIRDVFRRVDPSRLRVAAFGEPTALERDHDFLWRVHAKAPARGEIVIFDRSHYEGVLVERVHEVVKPAVWRKRFDEINAFEETLMNHGTVLVKCFLHMSKEEQKRRLEERLEDPRKSWKFSEADLRERQLWPRYMRAYEEAIRRTSTRRAPWWVVPSDERWHRDLVVAQLIVDALASLRLRYPRAAAKKPAIV